MSGQNTTSVVTDLPLVNKVIEVILLSTIILISVVGNGSLWAVVLRSRALRTITSMFILGLSMADLLVTTVNMPVTIYTIIVGQWTLSRDACVVTGFINMLTLSTSVLSLCNISINRYVMVCHPGRFKDIYTTKRSMIMMAGVVTLAAVVSMPPLFGWSEYVYTHTHSFCFADWANHMSYAFFMIGCCFCLPCTVMGACNFLIIHSVRNSRLRITSHINTSIYTSGSCNHSNTNDKSFYEHSVSPFVKSISVAPVESHATGKREAISQTKLENEENTANDNSSKNLNDFRDRKNSVTFSRNLSLPSGRFSDSSDIEAESNCSLIRHRSLKLDDSESIEMQSDIAYNGHINTMILNNDGDADVTNKHSICSVFLHPAWRPCHVGNGHVSSPAAVDSSVNKDQAINIDRPSVCSQSNPVLRHGSTQLRRREEVRLAFSLVVVVVVFVVCWLPYCVSMLLSIFHDRHIPREFHVFTLMIGYANSGCNPIVYGVMNMRFKIGFKRLFCFWRKHEMTTSSS